MALHYIQVTDNIHDKSHGRHVTLCPSRYTHILFINVFYVLCIGVPEQLREVARNSKPLMEITNSGDSWTIKTTVGDKVKDTTFTIGQEFESKSLIGSPLKV